MVKVLGFIGFLNARYATLQGKNPIIWMGIPSICGREMVKPLVLPVYSLR